MELNGLLKNAIKSVGGNTIKKIASSNFDGVDLLSDKEKEFVG